MILVTSDTHCYYDTINQQVEYAEAVLNNAISCVIHLGDFGIYKANLHEYFIRKGKRFIRPVYFIEGNHEDFQAFPRLTEKYRDFFTYLPRGNRPHPGWLPLSGARRGSLYGFFQHAEGGDHHRCQY